MKHILRLLALLLCLSLCACAQTPEAPQGSTPPAATQPTNPGKPLPGATQPTLSGQAVDFRNPGAAKVEYSVNISSVRYVTDAAQLPHYEALEQYDDAYFETKALVVILDSVSSGATRPTVASITYDAGKNTVELGREADSTITIPVMTTWLLWVEVERALPGSWEIANPSLPDQTVTS